MDDFTGFLLLIVGWLGSYVYYRHQKETDKKFPIHECNRCHFKHRADAR